MFDSIVINLTLFVIIFALGIGPTFPAQGLCFVKVAHVYLLRSFAKCDIVLEMFSSLFFF